MTRTQSKRRGGRHWNVTSKSLGPELIAYVKNETKTRGARRFDWEEIVDATPDTDKPLAKAFLAIALAGRILRVRLFLGRKTIIGDTPEERIREVAIERENIRRYLRLPSLRQLAKSLGNERSSVTTGRMLGNLRFWLKASAQLYEGELGDPRALGTMIRSIDEWRGGRRPDADSSLLEDISSIRDAETFILHALFNPAHLANYKGEPQANARGWIIRQLDAMIPKSLTIADNRYAVLAELLTFVGIPADPVVVKDALRRKR